MSRRVTASKRPASPPAGQFTDKEFVERMKAYRRPLGHPQGTVCRMMPDSTHIRELRMLIEASWAWFPALSAGSGAADPNRG